MNPLASSFRPKVTYADKLKTALEKENGEDSECLRRMKHSRGRLASSQSSHHHNGGGTAHSNVLFHGSSGEKVRQDLISRDAARYNVLLKAPREPIGSPCSASGCLERQHTSLNGPSSAGEDVDTGFCHVMFEKCRPDDASTRGGAVAPTSTQNDIQSRTQQNHTAASLGFGPPITQHPNRAYHPYPFGYYLPGIPPIQAPGMFGHPGMLTPGPYPRSALHFPPQYYPYGMSTYPPRFLPPSAIHPYYPPYVALSAANSNPWAAPDKQERFSDHSADSQTRPQQAARKKTKLSESAELDHYEPSATKYSHADAKRQVLTTESSQNLPQVALSIQSVPSPHPNEHAPIPINSDSTELQCKDEAEIYQEQSTTDSSTRGSSESYVSAQSPDSSLLAAELISGEIIAGHDDTESGEPNKLQTSTERMDPRIQDDLPLNAPKGPASHRRKSNDKLTEASQPTQINKRPPSGSWSQSKRWVSQETHERMVFHKMAQNLRYLGADKSPFVPRTPAELAAFKIGVADARARIYAAKVRRMTDRVQARKAAAAEESSLPELELFNGKQLTDNLSPVLAADDCFQPGHLVESPGWPTLAAMKEDGDRRAGRHGRYFPLPEPRCFTTPCIDYEQLASYLAFLGLKQAESPVLGTASPPGHERIESSDIMDGCDISYWLLALLEEIEHELEEDGDRKLEARVEGEQGQGEEGKNDTREYGKDKRDEDQD